MELARFVQLIVFLKFLSVKANCPTNCDCTKTKTVHCSEVTANTVASIFNKSNIVHMNIANWLDNTVNLSLFNEFSNLQTLDMFGCRAKDLIADGTCELPSLLQLSVVTGRLKTVHSTGFANCAPRLFRITLKDNVLTSLDLSSSVSIVHVDLSGNKWTQIPRLPKSTQSLNMSRCSVSSAGLQNLFQLANLVTLDLSLNKLTRLSVDAFVNLASLQLLLLNENRIGTISVETFTFLKSLKVLDLSRNRIVHFGSDMPDPCRLDTIVFDENPLENMPRLRCASLKVLSLSHTSLSYVAVDHFRELSALKILNLSQCTTLQSIIGNVNQGLSALDELDISGCALELLSVEFLTNSSLKFLKADGNRWHCDCRLLWALSLPKNLKVEAADITQCLADRVVAEQLRQNCSSIGISQTNGRIQVIRLATPMYIRCGEYGYPTPSVLWEAFRFEDEAAFEPVCSWDAETAVVIRYSQDNRLECIPGGALRLLAFKVDDGAPLRCRAKNSFGASSSVVMIHFDFSFWRQIKINSIICAIAVLFALALINLAYIFLRRLIVWRISRMERTGLVRRTLEAVERYRQRQLEALYDMYTNRMQLIVENYHQQMDQVKKSYMQQSDRFRDYRTAQIESVSQHLDSLYGSYAQQVNRVRDYGSRRMEQLWLSYQRQLNRLRTFTVQQRLRMMRQYRLRQKYFSKLLETFYSDPTKYAEQYRFIDPTSLRLPEFDIEELTAIPLMPITDQQFNGPSSSNTIEAEHTNSDEEKSEEIKHGNSQNQDA